MAQLWTRAVLTVVETPVSHPQTYGTVAAAWRSAGEVVSCLSRLSGGCTPVNQFSPALMAGAARVMVDVDLPTAALAMLAWS